MEIESSDSKEVRCEMHSCLRFPMRLCRWCGAFPVEGLAGLDIRALRFNVRSVYGLYCLSTLLGHLWLMTLSVVYFFRNPFNVGTLSSVVFTGSGFASSINIYVLAKTWPELMKEAAKIESRLVEIRISKRTHVKCTCFFLLVLSMSFVKIIVHLIFGSHLATICADQDETKDRSEFLFRSRLVYVYDIISYNRWTAMIFEFVNFRMTWLGNMHDLVPVCFGVYLTSYFRDLNKVIYDQVYNVSVETGDMTFQDASSWNQLRAHYADVVTLLHEVDSRLYKTLFISYASGLFFVCVQMFNCLRQEFSSHMIHCQTRSFAQASVGLEHDAFYIFTLLMVTVRLFTISLFAANVNHEAVKPIAALHSAPTSAYGLEIQRFHRQITYEAIALGGVFFHVTRPIILQVIAAIITYELVLLDVGKLNVEQNFTIGLDEFVNYNSTV